MAGAEERLLQYGVESSIARKAEATGLTVTKVRNLSHKDLASKFGLTETEAKHLAGCVKRKAIADNVVNALLEASNYTCSVCRGTKASSFIIHHIEEYEKNQDNSYENLIVLCPNDHDLAHRPGGLTNDLNPAQLRSAKKAWEAQVELANVQRAATSMTVDNDAIDYFNVKRIEDLCIRLLGEVPITSLTASLTRAGIINADRRFDLKFIRDHLSGGRYLFDYSNHSEAEYFRQLLVAIAKKVDFEDLSDAAQKGFAALSPLVGKYAYFVGGVYSKRPQLPIDKNSGPLTVHYPTRKLLITWDLDPNYLYSMSAISRMGRKNLYIIYCLVRTVEKGTSSSPCRVTASPLLIAQPAAHLHKTPAIFYEKQYEDFKRRGLIEL
ncbi:HNH endonuclease signature motif containing protein [Sinorhizobium meliloti]|uniref:HNH endonuclease signature motif containing protein n=1 Tax=Rhizobium meliloti TaxID=382 RepID=UPI00186598C9|nr:HNH endonuclease signature motif containing protein [Sinorhizobium meliloti]